VCWLLNGSASTGVWKQNIDIDTTPDASPNFTGAAVYYGYTAYDTNGFGSTMSYSNTALAESLYQPATLNDNDTADNTTDDYYEIANAGQLYWFAEKANANLRGSGLNGRLTADITVNTGDVSGCGGTKADDWRDWTPINGYSCTFDGCGKTISGLYLVSDSPCVGLFGGDIFGTVKNLTLTNSYLSGAHLGGICNVNNGTIENCVNEATVCGTDNAVGGICGSNYGTIANCGNTGTVSGLYAVGGVCGINENSGSVMNCYNTAAVTGGEEATATAVGAICGNNMNGATVTNCYYLAGCATDVTGTVQYGIGGSNPGQITADVAGSTTAKTAEQFASGEVCWLLNGSASTGVWKQDIDNDSTPDASPNFTGAAVYLTAAGAYSNTPSDIVTVEVTWGAMEFTYSDGTWNAATHQYDGAGWTAAEGGNAVTVKNSGAVNVSATLSYTPTAAYTAITGSFGSDVTAAIAINEEKKWLLSLSGKPAGAMSNIKLGTVTVTIGGE